MKQAAQALCIGIALLSGAAPVQAVVVDVPVLMDSGVISGTQFAGENQSNQGAHPEIEPSERMMALTRDCASTFSSICSPIPS